MITTELDVHNLAATTLTVLWLISFYFSQKKYLHCALDKYSSQFGSGNNPYAYFHEEDESSFQLVDSTRVQKPIYQRGRGRFNQVSVLFKTQCYCVVCFDYGFVHFPANSDQTLKLKNTKSNMEFFKHQPFLRNFC